MSNRSRNRAIVDFDSPRPGNSQPRTSSDISQKKSHLRDNDCNEGVFNATETELIISNCIRFILFHEYTKTLIKQSDINKYLNENHYLKRNETSDLMNQVSQKLYSDFGFRLIEVPEAASKSYILHTIYKNDLLCFDKIEEEDDDDNIFDESILLSGTELYNNVDVNIGDLVYDDVIDASKRALLLISLSLIFLEETQTLCEKDLLNFLEEIGLDLEAKCEIENDSSKQNIKKLISEEFVRKNYLRKIKKPNLDSSTSAEFYYEWGIRAQIEFKKSDILKFITEIYECNDVYLTQLKKRVEESDKIRESIISGKNSTLPKTNIQD